MIHPALAFGNQGHRLICQLAYQNLPLSTQHTLDVIIGQIPKYHQQRINKQLRKPLDANISFADSCVWPDSIKRLKSFKHHSRSHYVNVTRTLTQMNKAPCKKDCVTSAIYQHGVALLNNTTNKSWQDLLFISHYIGDVHQPMHVSYQSDLGGNKTPITYSKALRQLNCKTMHSLWDRCLLYYLPKQFVATQPLNAATAEFDSFSEKNILSWANQSLSIARSPSTKYCYMVSTSSTCHPYNNSIIIDEHYISRHSKTIQQQIEDAARRLNLLLVHIE